MAAVEAVPFGRRMRPLLRDTVTMLAVAVTLPAWGLAGLARRCGMSDRFFLSCGQTLSLFPGMAGIFLRRGFYLMCLDRFGRDCCVEFGTYFSHPEVSIGVGVYIGGRCTIGKCSIGDHALIGSNVDILSGHTSIVTTIQAPPDPRRAALSLQSTLEPMRGSATVPSSWRTLAMTASSVPAVWSLSQSHRHASRREIRPVLRKGVINKTPRQ